MTPWGCRWPRRWRPSERSAGCARPGRRRDRPRAASSSRSRRRPAATPELGVRRRPRPRREAPARPAQPPGLVALPRASRSRRARGDLSQARILAAVQWQADHFEEAPVVVVACLRGRAPGPGHRGRPTRTTARSSPRSRTCCWRPGPSASAPRSPPSPSGRARWPAAPSASRANVTPVRGDPAGLADGAATGPRPGARSRRSPTSTATGTGRFSDARRRRARGGRLSDMVVHRPRRCEPVASRASPRPASR